MAEDRWEVDVDEAPTARKLRALGAFMSDLRPFWPLVVPAFVRWMRDQFKTEGAWGGAHWAPLSAGYAAWKAQRYPGRGILYAEGDMRMAASKPARIATPTTLTLVISDPKIGWHQTGTGRMPARPVVPENLPRTALLELDGIAEGYVRDVIRRLGLHESGR